MSTSPSLTATQHQVLALITAGLSATAAAHQAGVHRNTVANWLQSHEFRSALERARTDKQLLYWDQAETLAARAVGNLGALMDDPQVPAAVRLKATIVLLEHARMFLPVDPGLVLPDPAEPIPAPGNTEITHKNAQEELGHKDPETTVPTAFHADHAPEIRPGGPKVGRNELCPCGSGIKFKRCCSGNTAPPPADASEP